MKDIDWGLVLMVIGVTMIAIGWWFLSTKGATNG